MDGSKTRREREDNLQELRALGVLTDEELAAELALVREAE
jgi:hypothetical protein